MSALAIAGSTRKTVPMAYRVVATLCGVALATLIRLAFSPLVGHDVPFVVYIPTIALVAWYAGSGCGLLATAASSAAIWLLFLPQHEQAITHLKMALFALGSGTIVWVMTSLNRARVSLIAAREAEALQRVWFESMLGSIAEGVIATDSKGALTYMNRAAQEMIGASAESVLGRPFAQVVSLIDESTELAVTDLEKLTPQLRLMLAIANKPSIPVAASVSTMQGAAGAAGSVLILRIAIDERERYLLIEEAGAARRDAEAANRMKDDFLRMVSHELRAPLNAILGWADVIQRKPEPDTITKGTETIKRNVRAQASLIDSMLDVAAIASGRFAIELRDIYLPDTIDDALRSIEPIAASKGIRLLQEIDRKDVLTRADANRLQQVLANLYSNAIKFTPSGGAITTTLRYKDDSVQIEVADSGQGMDATMLTLLFERSGGGEQSLRRSKSGLGLGLPIARRIVELHGGRLIATSAGEQLGTTVTLDFPLKAAASASPAEDEEGSRLAILASSRILVVDDDAQAALLLANVLARHGAEIQSADSARRALEIYQRWQADAIVSDIGMPGEDGHWLIAQIRKLESRRHKAALAALAVTAYGRAEDRERSRAAGFDGHLVKPVSSDAVAHALAEALMARNSEAAKTSGRVTT